MALVNFRSDNESSAAPEILGALAAVNTGAEHAYGDDQVTARVKARFGEVFERDVEVFPVATGTAANALSIAQLTPPYGSALCFERSHLYHDECGAPEFFSGGKLITVAGVDGKITKETLTAKLGELGGHGEHESKPSALSITQASEYGSVYRCSEIAELSALAREAGLGMHMDGARFANAMVSLQCTAAEMTWKAGIDILSFGATKNGAMAAEAVVVFNPEYAEELWRRRKRAGHLFSKMRFVAAQLEAYLQDDLWLRLAAHSNGAAQTMAVELADLAGISFKFSVEANELFVQMPASVSAGLREAGFEFHTTPGMDDVYRLLMSHDTRLEDVHRFSELCRKLTATT
jgi:threonine aldolase